MKHITYVKECGSTEITPESQNKSRKSRVIASKNMKMKVEEAQDARLKKQKVRPVINKRKKRESAPIVKSKSNINLIERWESTNTNQFETENPIQESHLNNSVLSFSKDNFDVDESLNFALQNLHEHIYSNHPS